MTYQAPVEVAVLEAALRASVTSPDPTSPSMAGVTSGETRCTSAPAAISVGTRRWATLPPPTTSTLRPASRSPTG